MRRLILAASAAALALASCAKPTTRHDTKVVLQGREVVHRDAKGAPAAVEVSVEYPECPGEQLETLQAGAEFAACLAKYKIGDTLPATIVHAPTADGHYDSEIDRLGDCTRRRDARDARSYEVVQICEDVVVNGVVVGFHCDRRPSKELVAKCPWFARK